MNRVDLLFDVRCYRMSGIGRYIKGELSALGFNIPGTSLGNADVAQRSQSVGLFCRREETQLFVEAGCKNIVEWEAKPFSVKEQFLSSLLLRKALERTGTIWFPHWNVPFVFSKPKGVEMILTVHDLIPWTFPAYAKTLKSRLGWPVFLNAVRKADIIRCVSKATRDVLFEMVPEARSKKVEIRYPNVLPSFLKDSEFQRSLREKPWPEKWHFEKGQYALYVGNLKPHKGVDFLIEVWREIRPVLPESARLVLVGRGFGGKLPLHIETTPGIVALGEVPDEEIWQLYANAKVFCCPSLMEGFGIPPLEAQSLGVPVVSTVTPSLAEYCKGKQTNEVDKKLWVKELSKILNG